MSHSDPPTPYSIELQGVSKYYGRHLVVDQLSLQVKGGEFLTLLGSSGCGKTTTLRLIAGLETVSQGQIWIGEQNMTTVPPYDRQVSLVFQDYALFPHLTVEANIAFGLKMQGVPLAQRQQRVQEMLALVQLPQIAQRRPGQLSGGQRQRVALARALALEPTVLLLDEPLGALDAELRRQMQGELKRIQTQLGMTFIYVTHDQEEALIMSDRIVVMQQGRIEQIGTPHEIYDYPQTLFVAQFIGQCNLRQGPVVDCQNQQVAIADAVLGQLKVQVPIPSPNYTPGQIITVMIRPEKIKISPFPITPRNFAARQSSSASPETDQVTGTIQTVTYAGSVTRLIIAVREAELLVETHGRSSWKVGERVHLHWSVEDAIALSETRTTTPVYQDVTPTAMSGHSLVTSPRSQQGV
ncbi:MAG: ABC transporter ATP-binding protein [Cyanobacteria bacterium P01_F01_bin.86]